MTKNKGKKKVDEKEQALMEELAEETLVSDSEHEKEEISEVDQLKSEIEEHKDKYLRLYSEFDNFRRRTAKEKLELTKTASEGLTVALLPVVDDFERGLVAFTKEEDQLLKEGVELVYQKLVKILEQQGVKTIEVNEGDDFNDEVHEAITQMPAPIEKLKGKIIDVVEKGYLLNDKVVRFAKVVTGA
ncbi:MAG: nucleotide exchange factor GrpE [Bacteroidetes bacterium]|nr:nucleotide exchange factor GrpE [Bacteroidota bacterium]MDA1119205.1 nucleotide exchange factor GrpE [Bacteroidota bacterium]